MNRVATVILRWPVGVIAVAVVLTTGSALLSARLRVDADLWKLLPPEYPSYRALERLRTTVGGENPLEVVIESPSFEANRSFADSLIPVALASRFAGTGQPFFRAVSFRRDAAFLEQNALYFATTDELTRLMQFLEDLKAEARRRANPFNRRRADAEARLEATADSLRAAAARLPMGEYPVSSDSTVMVVRLYPGSSQADLRFVDDALRTVEGLIAQLVPARFHPAMTVRLGGRYVQEHLEAHTIARDGQRAAVVGVPVVLLLVLGYFGFKTRGAGGPARLAVIAAVICVPLVMSIVWTYALAYLAFGALNVVTTTIGLVLFGVGVDYGIHFFAMYADARSAGRPPDAAIRETFASAGSTTVAGAATTVAALFVLAMADFRAFREFGVLTGTGIILSLVAMLVVLPAMAVLADRRGLLFGAAGTPRPPASGGEPESGGGRRAGWVILVVGTAVTAGSALAARHVEFEYDTSRLQPSFPDYQAVLTQVAQVYPPDGRENPAYVVADTPDDVAPIVSALREHMAGDRSPTILSVEALQDRFPMTPAAQRDRLDQLARIRALLDGAVLSRANSGDLQQLRRAAETTRPLALEHVPGHLTAPFRSKDGNVGNLIQVYSSVDLTDARNSMAFAEDVGTITTGDGRTYHAASMAVVAADMIRLMQREILQMVGICLAVIAGVMLFTFRSVRWTAVALVPTVLGLLWMLGIMTVTGMRLNFFNLVALPVVLGVGDDTGVHLVQAFRAAPVGARRAALRSAAERVLVAALTTVAGFGALMITRHPGILSIGTVAALGIVTTLVAGIVLMPRLLWLLLFLAIVPVAAHAQASLVPADHPVYEWLRRQRALGNAPGFSSENLPLYRRQITDLLAGIDGRDRLLSSVDRILRRRYAAEFALDTVFLRRPVTLTQGWDTNFGKTVRQKVRVLFSDRELHAVGYGDELNNITIDYRWGAGGVAAREGGSPTLDEYSFWGVRGFATLERRLGFHVELAVPYHTEALRFHPQWSQTPEATYGQNSVFFAQGYASWDRHPFGLDVGTGTVRLGLGARQAVILRADSPNFNWIRFRFDTKVVQYTFLHGALDSPTRDTTVAGFPTRVSPPRWIAVRRYQARPFGPVQLAITEAVTYSNRGLDFAYLNPVYPLKAAELDTGDKDDPIIYLDLVFRPVRGVEIYGTLGIDDLYGPGKLDVFRPTGRRSNNDHTTKLLYQGGAQVALKPGTEAQVEFLRIEPFFYTHFLPLNTFQARGFGLANDLGPNADEWWLALRQWVPWRGWIRGSVRVARQGLNVVDSTGRVVQDVGGDLTSTHNGQAILHLAGDLHHWHTWAVDAAVEPWPGVAVRFEYQRRLVTRGTRIPNRHVLRSSVQFNFYPLGFLLSPFGL